MKSLPQKAHIEVVVTSEEGGGRAEEAGRPGLEKEGLQKNGGNPQPLGLMPH